MRPMVLAAFSVILAERGTSQTFTTLHSFNGNDGTSPSAGLILSSNTLYGTAKRGGSSGNGNGTVFGVKTDGTGFTNLHSFTPAPYNANSDGANPSAGLILSGDTLYGTAGRGGSSGNGTVFAINTDGTGFTTLHNFAALSLITGTNSDGASPSAGLILSSNTLYGTTEHGGSSGNGTVFAAYTDGTGFTNLHSFNAGSDGANPSAGLTLSGNTLYGTAGAGGSSASGTLFALNSDGSGFTNLHNFRPISGPYPGTNTDGAWPLAGVILSGNTLYGTTSAGGDSGSGTVFAVNIDGTGFTNLHTFAAASTNSSGIYTNGEGANPRAALILSGNTLYGTASAGGNSGNGTVFAVHTDGRGFTTLHSFTAISGAYYTNSDGALPFGGLLLSGNTLYGTASAGGSSGIGTVFSLSLTPQLTITPFGANVVMSWPTNYAGFTLKSTTNLGLSFWTTNYPAPVVVNGQNFVTNPISGTRRFFRLSH